MIIATPAMSIHATTVSAPMLHVISALSLLQANPKSADDWDYIVYDLDKAAELARTQLYMAEEREAARGRSESPTGWQEG